MLRAKSGIVSAEVLSQRDGDAYTYTIESEVGVDIRKNLFYTLAEKNWPLIGMEAMGMSLEDIFIAIVDQTSGKKRYERARSRSAKGHTQIEQEIATSMLEKTTAQNTDGFSALFGSDNDKKN